MPSIETPLTNASGDVMAVSDGRVDSPIYDPRGKDLKGYPLPVAVDPGIVAEVPAGYGDIKIEGEA